MPLRSTLRLWLPAILWTAVIFAASSGSFSSSNTEGFLEKLIHALGVQLNPTVLEIIHFTIRKLSHVAEYGILGILVYRAVRADRPGWDIRWALTAILFAALVGSLDEWHQAFVPGRTATPWDTVIDTLGAALAQVLFFKP